MIEKEDTAEDTVDLSLPMRERSEGEYSAWYQGHFLYNAFANAAEAVRQEASRAFMRGCDEIALRLREVADTMDEQAERESSEWEKEHSPK